MNKLLLDLYACPNGQGRWPLVLDQLCRKLRVRSAVIQVILPDNGHLRSRWMVRDSRSEAACTLHDRYFSDAVNPRMLAIRQPNPADQHVVRDSDIFEPDDPLLADLKQRLAAAGLGRYLGAEVPLSTHEVLALVLHRDPNDEQDFTKREERLAVELMPHFRQALQLAGTVLDAQQQAQDLRETLDSFRFPLLLCNADSSLCWSNSAARRILEQRRQLWLNSGQLLTTTSASQTTALRQSIARAARDHEGLCDPQLFVLGGNGPNALQARVQGLEPAKPDGQRHFDPMGRASIVDPMGRASIVDPTGRALTVDPTGRALIVLCDPDSEATLPPDLLKRLFGLSPAESRLAAALCAGSTLNEYAARAGVAIGTARYQLKQAMAKMQVSKQSQLVQRLCTSVIFHLQD